MPSACVSLTKISRRDHQPRKNKSKISLSRKSAAKINTRFVLEAAADRHTHSHENSHNQSRSARAAKIKIRRESDKIRHQVSRGQAGRHTHVHTGLFFHIETDTRTYCVYTSWCKCVHLCVTHRLHTSLVSDSACALYQNVSVCNKHQNTTCRTYCIHPPWDICSTAIGAWGIIREGIITGTPVTL